MLRVAPSRGLLFGVVAVLLWSTVATAFKLALGQVSPSRLLASAVLVSAAVFALALLVRGRLAAAWSNLRRRAIAAAVLAGLNPLAYYSLLFAAYDRLPAHIAQAINFTWPIALSLLARFLLHRPLTRRDGFGMVAAYAGVLVICWAGGSATHVDPWGVGLALLSSVVWALFWIWNARNETAGSEALFQQFVVASPLAIAWSLYRDGVPTTVNPDALLFVSYVGTFEMGVTFLFWQRAVIETRHLGRLSALSYLSPALSLIWVQLVLDEKIAMSTQWGLGLILAGLLLQAPVRRPTTPIVPE